MQWWHLVNILRKYVFVLIGALKEENAVPVPDILINKYNRFVDGIFGRINKILKRSYDPVSVRLSTSDTKTKKTKTTTSKTKKRSVLSFCFFF